ncbi:sulfite exporter TauE/SafE family protein [Candidatus Colwellia aromaticivorans]|uniref:sulfite exporter TauE/SafE family protein n=1 Tax=Candidatus Colwellia aromaticivorans TaxID=2267621 RepID=UPI000DF36636|nr:sulfite exporter TauE/SafE family protein [Candidatus Colwellia aromaticivorans]
MYIEYILGLISFFTSVIAGVVGFGGGMLLIAVLPLFLNPSLIIPIHGITQLASNSSRMIFSLKDVQWSLLPKFLVGSIIGVSLFGFFLSNISTEYIPTCIGGYIILNLWSARFSKFIKKYENYYFIGFLQTGLGLIVGATGPLSLTVLTKELSSKDEIIATSSMFMTISHLAKIPVFMAIGVSLFGHFNLLMFMIFGSVLGSFVGTKLRLASNNDKLILVIKVLLSLMAVRMLASSITL